MVGRDVGSEYDCGFYVCGKTFRQDKCADVGRYVARVGLNASKGEGKTTSRQWSREKSREAKLG